MDSPFFFLLGMIGMALTSTINGFGQSKRGPLEGVWQTVEVTPSGTQGLTVKPGANLAIFTARHYSRIEVHTDKARPVVANAATATAEELREAWGPFVAEAGTYEVADNLITMHPIVAKNPAAMAPGTTMVYSYKLEGDTLTITAQRDRNGPVKNSVTVKLQRIE